MDIVTESELAAMIMMSGGSGVIQPLSVTQNGRYDAPAGVDGFNPVIVNVPNDFTLSDAANLLTIAEYVMGDSMVAIKVKENGGRQVSIDMNYSKPITIHDNYLFYTVWYYKNVPFLAIPNRIITQKQIDYYKGTNKIYVREIDVYKNAQFTASEPPESYSQSGTSTISMACTMDISLFNEDGQSTGHGEYDYSNTINISLFQYTTSLGAVLTDQNNLSLLGETLSNFYSDFNL